MSDTHDTEYIQDEPDEIWFYAVAYTVNCHSLAVPMFSSRKKWDKFWKYMKKNYPGWRHYKGEPSDVVLTVGTLICRRDGESRKLKVYVITAEVNARYSRAAPLPKDAIRRFGKDVNGGEGGAEQLTIIKKHCKECMREVGVTHQHHLPWSPTNPSGLLHRTFEIMMRAAHAAAIAPPEDFMLWKEANGNHELWLTTNGFEIRKWGHVQGHLVGNVALEFAGAHAGQRFSL